MTIFEILKTKIMLHFATQPKIGKILESGLISEIAYFQILLKSGDLLLFEKELSQVLDRVHNQVSELLISESAQKLSKPLKEAEQAKGGRNIEMRPLKIRLQTGHELRVESPYVKRPSEDHTGSRYLLRKHWGLIGEASPGLYDRIGFCAALCPSYAAAHQTLAKFGTHLPLSRVRTLCNHLGKKCFDYGEENLTLEEGESLAGKRVILSLDGGRTRTRCYTDALTQLGNPRYDTPWREPKLFVIDTLNQKGKRDGRGRPIYGCRFGKSDVLELLRKYLFRLNIHQARQVQIVADGAPWIWQKIKPMLLELGVDPDRIVETLDYYHASKYIYELVESMPKRISETQKKAYLKDFKQWIWEGESDKIVETCREIYKRPSKLIKRWIEYIDKHKNRTKYADFQEDKLLCGSGIIESGIRRIINLRFKNTSTFWIKENVEKLYVLRAALLTDRWELLINNIAKAA